MQDEYWNHNTAFHPEIISIMAKTGGRILDIGCGDGLLISRLAPGASQVVGIDCDSAAISRARERISHVPNAHVAVGRFPDDVSDGPYDGISCVAALHHMELRPALEAMRALLAPGGALMVIGLAKPTSMWDWTVGAAETIPIRIASIAHRETRNVGVAVTSPRESLAEIRAVAKEILPGAVVRRRFYFRYSLTWSAPL